MWTLVILGVLAGQPVALTVPGVVSEDACAAAVKRASIHGVGAFCVHTGTETPAPSGNIILKPDSKTLTGAFCSLPGSPSWCWSNNSIPLGAQ